MNEGINLLEPNKKNTSTFLRRIDKTRVLMVGLLFIVSVFSVILIILVAISPLPALQNQEESLKQTLFQSKTDIVKFELVNERLDAITSALAKRQVFDEVLALLQSKIANDSKITSIKIDKTSVVVTVES